MNYIIVNKTDNELCWSTSHGWVSDDFDIFDENGRDHVRLPPNGEWVQVPWKKEG